MCTDDGSAGVKGTVAEGIRLAIEKHPDIDECVAIGPPIMMKGCAEATRPHKIKTMVSLNPLMVDGTGMCGGCRVKIGDEIKFACVDGPDFDGHQVDFDDLMARLKRFTAEERMALEHWNDTCRLMKQADELASASSKPIRSSTDMAAKKKTIRTIPQERTPAASRIRTSARSNFAEVSLGYGVEEALVEADRCLQCADEPCVRGCPVGIDIPGFIQKIAEKHYHGAYDIITDTNLLPSICGRVCPQENQCEGVCTVGETLEPVAIGRLERFVGDTAIKEGWANIPYIEPSRLQGRHRRRRARPAWPARPTWRRPAARSPSTRRSTSRAACSSTASPISGCRTR